MVYKWIKNKKTDWIKMQLEVPDNLPKGIKDKIDSILREIREL